MRQVKFIAEPASCSFYFGKKCKTVNSVKIIDRRKYEKTPLKEEKINYLKIF